MIAAFNEPSRSVAARSLHGPASCTTSLANLLILRLPRRTVMVLLRIFLKFCYLSSVKERAILREPSPEARAGTSRSFGQAASLPQPGEGSRLLLRRETIAVGRSGIPEDRLGFSRLLKNWRRCHSEEPKATKNPSLSWLWARERFFAEFTLSAAKGSE